MALLVSVCAKLLGHVLFVTPWIVAHQTPLSMGFSRQEYWSGLPCPPPEVLPIQGSLTSPALVGGFFTTSAAWKAILGSVYAPPQKHTKSRRHLPRRRLSSWFASHFPCYPEAVAF